LEKTHYLKIGADGYPAVFGLPAPMNRLLFKNSRLFEYLSLRLSQRNNIELGREWERKVVPRIPEIAELAKSAGAKLVFVHYPTRLDKSFRQIVENPQAEHKVYLDAAKKYGMDVLRLDEAFSDLDYREITIDLAGHYNEKGHEAIAEALYRKTLKLLDPAPDR
jgi:hypothetical protein